MYSNNNSSGTFILTLFGAAISAAVVWFWPDLMGSDRTTAVAQPSLRTDATQTNNTASGGPAKPAINAKIDDDVPDNAINFLDPDSIPLWSQAGKYSEFGEFVPTSEMVRLIIKEPYACIYYSQTNNDCEFLGIAEFHDQNLVRQSLIMLSDRPVVVLRASTVAFIHDGLLCSDARQATLDIRDRGTISKSIERRILQKSYDHARSKGRRCTAYFRKDGSYWVYNFDMQGNLVADSFPFPFQTMSEMPELRMPHTINRTHEQLRAGKRI